MVKWRFLTNGFFFVIKKRLYSQTLSLLTSPEDIKDVDFLKTHAATVIKN